MPFKKTEPDVLSMAASHCPNSRLTFAGNSGRTALWWPEHNREAHSELLIVKK